MTGAEMSARVEQFLAALPTVDGLSIPDSRRVSMPGWPDWFFIGDGGLLAAELKGSNDTLSAVQRRVGRRLQAGGVRWVVWYPRHMMFGGPAELALRSIA